MTATFRIRLPLLKATIWTCLLSLSIGPAYARGCYGDPRVRSVLQVAPPIVERDVLVLVDQTVAYPQEVRQHALRELTRLARGGTRLSIGSFSSYSGRTYPRIVGTHFFEPPIPAAVTRRVNMRARAILNRCLRNEFEPAVHASQRVLAAVLNGSRPSITQSDIMSSLRQFGAHLRTSRAPQRVVVLISDMLENSSTTSFYGRGGLRPIDPAAELRRAVSAHLIADLGRARVFVIGAGLSSSPRSETIPDDWMQRLQRFWSAYFARSGATLAGFGRPVLLVPVG